MSNRNLTILGILAAVMVVWAVVQSRLAQESNPGPTTPSYLIQGLKPADIYTIVLGAGDKAVTLARSGDQFVLADKGNYPAETKEINQLITNCLDIKSARQVTANPDNHADLHVTPETAENVVVFKDKDGKELTGVILGQSDTETQGKYVRMINDNAVYLCDNTPWIRKESLGYINKELVDVDPKTIAEVDLRSDAGSYQILPGPKDQPALQAVPEGKKQKDSEVKQVFEAMSHMSLSDLSQEISGLIFDRTYICQLNNSTIYTLKIAEKDGKTYITLSAEFSDKTPVMKEDRKETEEELKKKEAVLLAQEHAKTLNEKHKGWIYEIPNWKAKYLTQKFDDLLETKEAPKPESSAEPSAETEPEPAVEQTGP